MVIEGKEEGSCGGKVSVLFIFLFYFFFYYFVELPKNLKFLFFKMEVN